MGKGPESYDPDQFVFYSNRNERLAAQGKSPCPPSKKGYFKNNKGQLFLLINLVLLCGLGIFAVSRIMVIEEGLFEDFRWKLSALRSGKSVFISLRGDLEAPFEGERSASLRFYVDDVLSQVQEGLISGREKQIHFRTGYSGPGARVKVELEISGQTLTIESAID